MRQFLFLLLGFLTTTLALSPRINAQVETGLLPNSDESGGEIRFREITSQAGVVGITVCGEREKSAVIEVNGSGLCWFDYNNDGFFDLFVVNGSTLQELRTKGSSLHSDYPNYLYRNNGDGTFTDIAEKAGVSGFAWGTGCAAADYDNDGFDDLFVANVGRCFLYKNNGDGTFTETAEKAGVSGGFNWHTGVAFGDYDSDGFLDLYVAGYVDPVQMIEPQKKCDWKGLQVYCGPPGLRGAPDALYRNNGDGTFSNVTRRAGVQDTDLLFGFTVSFEDFDNDGNLDIFVANDRGRNYLYWNTGNGHFKEVGEIWGASYPVEGKAQANMGVAIGDYDRNGTMDIFVTTFSDEHYTLYENQGNQFLMDASTESGTGLLTYPFLGWGTFFADLDNDGWLDLFAVNGHVYPEVDQLKERKEGFAQRNLLFRQSRRAFFTEIGMRAGLNKVKVHSSRGAAYADFDNDGDIDIIYTNLGSSPTLLENITDRSNRWLTIQTVGTRSNRSGIGARLRLKAGDLLQETTMRSSESYLSGNDPRVHFGLGSRKKIDQLEIRWPSGQIDKIADIQANQIITIQEGKGIVSEAKPTP